jgi:tetratricopeptide (TPR) repeat protein
VAYAEKGDFNNALNHYEHVLKLTSDKTETSDANNNIGIAYARQGEVESARSYYQQAIGVNPGNADAHYNLGLLEMQYGKKPDAIKSFQDALEHRQYFPAAQYQLKLALS